jgi:hypothetical protein
MDQQLLWQHHIVEDTRVYDPRGYETECRCGWSHWSTSLAENRVAHDVHVSAALAVAA